jgi:hypothetical protein
MKMDRFLYGFDGSSKISQILFFIFLKNIKQKKSSDKQKTNRFTVLFKNWILNKKPPSWRPGTFQAVDFTASAPSNLEKLIHQSERTKPSASTGKESSSYFDHFLRKFEK